MRISLLPAFFLSTCAMAQEPITAELVSNPFFETYQPEVAVSGNVIVGVMTAAAATAILSNELAVYSDGIGDPVICLRVTSRDGIYSSKNVYRLPAGVPGRILLPYRSRLADVVRSYKADELAIAATKGECDSGDPDHLLVSANADRGNTEAVLYLNSFGATDVFYQRGTEQVSCEYLSEGRRTTFDFICRLGSIEEGHDNPVVIIRERFGREQPAINMKIIGTN